MSRVQSLRLLKLFDGLIHWGTVIVSAGPVRVGYILISVDHYRLMLIHFYLVQNKAVMTNTVPKIT